MIGFFHGYSNLEEYHPVTHRLLPDEHYRIFELKDLSGLRNTRGIVIGTARGSVRSRSGSGNARFDAVYGDVDFASGAGQVSIGLPAGVAARLDVQTGTGDVVSDLPIEDRRTGTGTSITVRARIGSGDVRLFRAA